MPSFGFSLSFSFDDPSFSPSPASGVSLIGFSFFFYLTAYLSLVQRQMATPIEMQAARMRIQKTISHGEEEDPSLV